MKTSLVLTLATMLALSSFGCAGHRFRNAMHRGAPCGTTTPTTLPVVSDVAAYSPTCGWADTGCATCGAMPGVPMMMMDGGVPADGTIVLPEPQ